MNSDKNVSSIIEKDTFAPRLNELIQVTSERRSERKYVL